MFTLPCFLTKRLSWWLVVVVACAGSPPLFAQSNSAQMRAAFEKGEALRTQGKSAEAIPHLETALRLAPSVLGNDSLDTATINLSLANAYRDMGRYANAEPLYQRSLQIREAKLGAEHVEVAQVVNSLANLHLYQGQYRQAQTLYQRSLRIKEATLGANDPDVARTMSNLALAHDKLGQFADAERLYDRSLRIKESQPTRDEVSIAATQFSLAGLYHVTGRYAQAEDFYNRSLKTREAKLGAQHQDVALTLNALAELCESQGRELQAEAYYQRSLPIQEARLGKDHPEVANTLYGLASVSMKLGQFTKAEPLFIRSQQIREVKLGPDHPLVAVSLDTLANLYRITDRNAQAEPLFQRSLKIRETRFGANHPSVAASLTNMGLLYIGMNQLPRAEPLMQRGLKIFEANYGQDHPAVAKNLHYLGLLYWSLGQNDRAETMYQRALKISEAQLGRDHPDVARTVHNLGMVYAAQARWTEAASTFDRSRRLVRQQVAQVLPALSEVEQLSFLKNMDSSRWHQVLSLGVTRRSDPTIVAQSAAWLLNGKAIAQQVLVERALQTRDRKDATTARLSQQLADVRRQLASAMLATDKPDQAASRRRQAEQFKVQEQSLAKQLAQAAGRSPRSGAWVELNEIRSALPSDTVLIDILRVEMNAFQGGQSNPGPRYVAWLIPAAGQGDVEVVDLGDAASMEAAVQAVRTRLQAAEQTIRNDGEPDAEKLLRPALEALAARVLKPIEGTLRKQERWIISPDGALWLVPWEALAWDDGYVIEKHRLSYVVSGRDLLPPPPLTTRTNMPLIMANPDFDLDATQSQAETRRILTDAQLQSLMRSPTRSLQLGPVQRLPGTATEAEAVRPNLERFAKAAPLVYTGRHALEGVFKVFARPRVAILSTHGFFQDDQATASRPGAIVDDTPSARLTGGTSLENPLLRCGLLLAGVNRRTTASDPNQDDGVLTGLEIVSADLRGTELVVLSACETGLGQVRNGEGVAGLRQAFHLAGAQSVVATLWQISDNETARLMNDFFTNLADGQPKADALRNAQLARIQARREKSGAAHPLFWAAFTLTGP